MRPPVPVIPYRGADVQPPAQPRPIRWRRWIVAAVAIVVLSAGWIAYEVRAVRVEAERRRAAEEEIRQLAEQAIARSKARSEEDARRHKAEVKRLNEEFKELLRRDRD